MVRTKPQCYSNEIVSMFDASDFFILLPALPFSFRLMYQSQEMANSEQQGSRRRGKRKNGPNSVNHIPNTLLH